LILRAATDGERVNFLCLSCFRCWNVAFGHVQRVAPSTCGGCAARSRCTQAFAIDHPDEPSLFPA
jgi:hypothetical protein